MNVAIVGSHELESISLSPPIPELRTTTSDVSLRKSDWDGPERHGEMTLDWAVGSPRPSRELSASSVVGNHHSPMKTSRTIATNNFGVIGDRRFRASAQQKNRLLA